MTYADGVLPDAISRDPHSNAWLIFIDFAAGTNVQQWLQMVATPARDAMVAQTATIDGSEAGHDAVCTVGFGSSLFDKANLSAVRPLALSTQLPQAVPTEQHDIVFYVFSRSDALVAQFLRALTISDSAQLTGLAVERGYQRADKREVFGQRDGLRNGTPTTRPDIAFIPTWSEEPLWARGGSYMAFLKITQDVAKWEALGQDARAEVIGRRSDGSRLDLPEGTSVTAEREFANPTTPPATAHVRKAGPRGQENDPVQIFRRGALGQAQDQSTGPSLPRGGADALPGVLGLC